MASPINNKSLKLTMVDVDAIKGYDPRKPRKVPVKPWYVNYFNSFK